MDMQVYSDISESAPFLVINDNKRINLLPVLVLHEEAPDTGNINSWTEVPHATVDFEFPVEKWVHVGCEVSSLVTRGFPCVESFMCFFVGGVHFTEISSIP